MSRATVLPTTLTTFRIVILNVEVSDQKLMLEFLLNYDNIILKTKGKYYFVLKL